MKKLTFAGIAFLLLLLTPFWMWLFWLLQPATVLDVLIIDKTSMTPEGNEHISLNWILHHQKYTKRNGLAYSVSEDYVGFHPFSQHQYWINGLERRDSTSLDSLARMKDMVYVADTYGVLKNEWYNYPPDSGRSVLLYGGLAQEDVYFLQKMKEQKKLIITEFNFLNSPTRQSVRLAVERLLGIQWTGWTGRYFETLDSSRSDEVPKWLIESYQKQNGGYWPFRQSGIAFIHDTGTVVILEEGFHLDEELPKIITSVDALNRYGVPEEIAYPYWFDIVKITGNLTASAQFILHTSA